MSKPVLVLFWISLGIALIVRFVIFFNQSRLETGREVSFSALLLEEPKIYSRYQRFSLSSDQGQKIFITADLRNEYGYGEELQVRGIVEQKQLESGVAIWTMTNPRIEASQGWLTMAGAARERFAKLYHQALPRREAGLLLGIVFGIKEDMTPEFKKDLQVAGVYHVVAASGMNVTMLAGMVIEICLFFMRRRLAVLVTMVIIGIYAGISGFDAPIVRASIMTCTAFVAQLFGKQYSGYYVLLLTATLMLLASPSLLLSLGFQLSFLATVGMLVVAGQATGEQNKSLVGDIFTSVKSDFVTSLAAIIATLPIVLGFGTFSLWALSTNILVLWTIAPLCVIGAVGAILGIFLPQASVVILWLSLPLLYYFDAVVMQVSKFPGVIDVQSIHWSFVAGYYSILAAIVLVWKQRK